MFGIGLIEVVAVAAALTVVALSVVYWVVRLAVRDGLVDGQRRLDADRVRSQARLGAERSPNSRTP